MTNSIGDAYSFYVEKVEIYVDGNLVGTAALGPRTADEYDIPIRDFSYTITGLSVGFHSIGARAFDNGSNIGAAAGSTRTVWIEVVANDAPVVQVSASATKASAPGTITMSATATDSVGGMDSVEFLANGTPLTSYRIYGNYTYTWTNVPAGTYSITARAYDIHGKTGTSTPVSVTISPPANSPPSVTLAPSSPDTVAPGGVTITANASDVDGSISSVRILRDGAQVGTSTSVPYTYNATGLAAGTYRFTAVARDNAGAEATSAPYTLTVTAPTNASPTVTLSTSGATTTAPGKITLSATASDSDGTIARVRYYRNGVELAALTTAPYTYAWTNVAAGTYSIQAVAEDNLGATGYSSTYNFVVTAATANTAPTVTLQSPASGTVIDSPLPTTLSMSASASDSDGTIKNLQFFVNGTAVSTLTAPPYSASFNVTAAGTYTIQVKATDDDNAVGSSATATVTVLPSTPAAGPLVGTEKGYPGTIDGQANVSVLGRAEFNIPLVLPPGVANFAPKLSLNYDSSDGNGPLGVGWTLAGLSSITRCTRDIAHDGANAAIDMSANDKFCLDGQRLILVNGTYGASGSEYRIEQDNYSKITAMGSVNGGPEYFIAYLRDGTKIEFGNLIGGRMILTGHSSAMAWFASRSTDPRGNSYSVKYLATPSGVPLVSQISYTGNASNGSAETNTVVFIYDTSRTDAEVSYLSGGQAKVSNRLARILIASDLAGAGTFTNVKYYNFGYQYSQSTSRSRLVSISECDGETTSACKPATTLTWESTSGTKGGRINYPGFTEQFGALDANLEDKIRSHWVDLNGDGVPEHCVQIGRMGAGEEYMTSRLYCGMTQPNGAAPVALNLGNFDAPSVELEFLDFNGDGLTDICQGNSCSITGPTKPRESFVSAPGPYAAGDIQFFQDVNGDGRVDFCAMRNGGVSSNPYRMTCFLYSGTAWGAAQDLGVIPVETCRGSSCQTLRFAWVSLTSDNIPSFCRLDGNVMRCRKWTPSGFGAEMSTGPINIGDRDGRAWTDVNGDGLDDFCRVIPDAPITQQGADQGKGRTECTLATGTGFGATVTSATMDIGRGSLAPFDTYRSWLDVNDDGNADFCRSLVAGGSACAHSTGGTFSGETTFVYADATRLVDATGDGRVDDCTWGTSDNASDNFCVASQAIPTDVVLSIKDGLGATSTFEYSYPFNPAVYMRGTGSVFPVADVMVPDHVVSALRLTDGNGAERKHTYKYEAARVHQQGRGPLGFAAMTRNDASGLTVRSEFLQNFPYTGLVSRVLTKNGSVTVSDIATQYSATSTAPYKIHQVSSVSKTYNPDGSFLNWVETLSPLANIDAYGNIGLLSTIWKDASGTADGYSRSMAVVYNNDTTNWILGQPSTITLTSKAPGRADSVRSETKTYHTSNPGLGMVKQHVIEPNNGNLGVTDLRLVTDYVYDVFGNLKTRTVSGANIETRTEVTYDYDLRGRGPVSITNALGHKEIISYDWRFGSRSSLTDANTLKTSWTYDAFGRMLTQTNPDGTVTTRTYNRCVSCVPYSAYSATRQTTVPATGMVVEPPSREYFDILGRSVMVVTTSLSGKEVLHRRQYDKLGRLRADYTPYFAGSSPAGSTRYDYDVLDRAYLVTAPDNTTVRTDYAGRKVTTTNYKGVKSAITRNSQEKVVSVIDAEGSADSSTTTYEYDNWGNEVKRTDYVGNITSREIDLRGRMKKLIDPDLGTWTYTVDNLGQRITQTDAKLQKTTYTYDLLGRMKRRLEPDQDSKWFYETNAAGAACAKSVGKLCESTSTNGYFRRIAYDSLGRQERITEHIDVDYATSYTYDAAGRLATRTSPAVSGFASPFAMKYNYTATGHLQSISNNSTGAVLWTKTSENAAGSTTTEKFGNSVVGMRTYDPLMNRLLTLQSGTGAAPFALQNHVYQYDALGRLEVKEERQSGVNTIDTFSYDTLDRLKTATVKNSAGVTVSTSTTYNAIGNIVTRTGLGTYTYPTAGAKRPHAVTRISGTVDGVTAPSYLYDDNGNLSSGGQFTVTWMSFNMPSAITKATPSLPSGKSTSTFLYGADHQRVKQTWTDTTRSVTTFYVNGGEFEKEIDTQTGLTQYKHYLQADGRQVAVQTRLSNGTENVRYIHPDRLGSTNVVTDASGAAMERMAFDAWGDRRNATTAAADPTNLIQPASTDRGFTGHESLDLGNMGLVHMNARVYHPALGRFLSPDTIVPDRFNTQDLNRYSYVGNGPTNAVDPSGHIQQVIISAPKPPPPVSTPLGLTVLMGPEAGYAMQQMVVPRNTGLNAPLETLVRSWNEKKMGQRIRAAATNAVKWYNEQMTKNSLVWKAVQLMAAAAADSGGDTADAASDAGTPGTQESDKGCIYCVPGEKTSSGKDYIGSTDNLDQRKRDKTDGRDREGARIVGEYDKGNRDERRNKEQQAINDHGGVRNLDNRRNEVRETKWGERGITPPGL
ncbi:Ig-like domain-containing protein [Massilia sp. METH4]|uniref:Ig-like domain-containing protein n=1 Tax=Massilia sp. METH4 TaxID=3123041 RepID=UPI0030D4EA3B